MFKKIANITVIVTLLLLCFNVNAVDQVTDATEKKYTSDWFSGHIPHWDAYKSLFNGLENKRCLEIGAYEGRATLYLVENYCNGKGSYVDAVDTWKGSTEHKNSAKNFDLGNLYNRFINNLKPYINKHKVNVYRGMSSDMLMKFVQEVRVGKREKYDFIYIDASHIAKDVLMDAVLAWELLKIGGLMFFDDYEWGVQNVPQGIPKTAIDGFLNSYVTMYELLEKNNQVRIKKISNSPKL